MEKRLQEFLNAMGDNTAYGYIAGHYTEFTKEELKDIILECLYAIKGKDKAAPQMLDIKFELQDRWEV